ncbi:MAG: zinc-binding dehydrogenase [Candidatus Neomarinimicrobiota bacterium]|nr:zinc-binding dehydrogenase [Candidatus Neomarinimicrobiota bacterium]
MRIAALYGAHDFRIETKASPDIKDDECLVRVRACGVCHSEIHQWAKTLDNLEYPRYIGHEVSGEILKCGSAVKGFKRGDRVAVWTDRAGYAEEVAVRANQIFPIADQISFAEAMAEPIACTTNGVIKAGVELGDTVVLVGTGFMGLILMQQIALKGASRIIGVDVRAEILDKAKMLGADLVINPQKEDVPAIIWDMTNGRGADVVFEVGGNQASLDLAVDLLRMEGKLVIFGYHPGQRIIKDLGYWNWMAFNIVNAHFRDMATILRGAEIGIKLLNEQKINMKPLITHKFKLDEIEAAFCAAQEKPKRFIKAVIEP